jgi:hypothetical protein
MARLLEGGDAVAALIIEPLGVFFCEERPREFFRLRFLTRQFLTQAVSSFAMLR